LEVREISVLDAIYLVNGAWKDIDVSTIQKCFVRCGFSEDVFSVIDLPVSGDIDLSDDDDDEVPLAVLRLSQELFDCDFNELIQIDQSIATQCSCTIDWSNNAGDILADLREDERDVDDTASEEVSSVFLGETQECLEKLKSFALGKGQNTMLDRIMTLQELFSCCRTEVSSKQSKISNFFK
jgi:hypothetical protein